MLLADSFSARAVRSVLRSRALGICNGLSGPAVPAEALGRLSELADVAGALGLDDEAARLSRLAAVARRGYTRDLARAALAVLAGDA